MISAGVALVLPDLEHLCIYLILGLLETLVIFLALAIAGCPFWRAHEEIFLQEICLCSQLWGYGVSDNLVFIQLPDPVG